MRQGVGAPIRRESGPLMCIIGSSLECETISFHRYLACKALDVALGTDDDDDDGVDDDDDDDDKDDDETEVRGASDFSSLSSAGSNLRSVAGG